MTCITDIKIMEILTLFAIIFIPIFVFCLQKREKILEQKHKNFLTLMAYRKNQPTNEQFVSALNLVEVLHHNNKVIVNSLHNYRKLLFNKESTSGEKEKGFVEMAFLISKHLGYKNLDRKSIKKAIGIEDVIDR